MLFLLLLLLLPPPAAPQPLPRTDLAALYSLRASLGLRARDWPAKSDPCTAWRGVTCRAGRVLALTLAGLRRTRLAARAPRFALHGLANLTALQQFNASGFPLPGEIPAWFARALPPSLALLDLTSAALTGALPAHLASSGNLTTLLLSRNNLSGPLPPSLLSLNPLRLLDLSANNFTGELPRVSLAAGHAPASSLLNVSGNSLYGVAGDAIAALNTRFQVVDVSSNYLDGLWNGSDGAVLVTMNCFSGVPAQRTRLDCRQFYSKQGVRLLEAPTPSPHRKQRIPRNALIAVLAAAAALMLLFFVALLLCFMRRRRGTRGAGGVEPNQEGARSGRRRDSSVNPVASSPAAMSPRANKDASAVSGEFTYQQLLHATGGFGDHGLIKHGHSGDIYHGVLDNGSHVVVKKVGAKSINKHAGELDFYTRYSHDRIVPLLGHFAKDGEEFLAYKYMPKGDLTNALHKKPVDAADALPSLDWITRLKIATGVAEAMCFLHDECNPPLVHRDIQASSVLLDDKFEVRLGSMSDICAQQSGGSQNVFSRILRSSKSLEKHTAGGPPASCSYDVQCFGKVLLELVTGKMGISGSKEAAAEEWVASTVSRISAAGDKESVAGVVDPLLVVEEDHLEEVWAVAVIAKTCLTSRPSARYVLRALHSPLRVARPQQLRSSSSRSSWQSAFGAGSGGDASFSFKRAAREIAPDPDLQDDRPPPPAAAAAAL